MSKQWIMALSLLAAGAAWAEGPIDWPPQEPFSSTLTREQVRAEMFAARASGELASVHSEDSGAAYLAQIKPVITLTREQVLAELFAARESGELDAMNGEGSGAVYLARRAPVNGKHDVLVAGQQRQAN